MVVLVVVVLVVVAVEVAAYVVAPAAAATAIDESSLVNGVVADHDTADGVVAVDDDADDDDDEDESTDDEVMIGRRHDGNDDKAACGSSHVAEMPLFIVEMLLENAIPRLTTTAILRRRGTGKRKSHARRACTTVRGPGCTTTRTRLPSNREPIHEEKEGYGDGGCLCREKTN